MQHWLGVYRLEYESPTFFRGRWPLHLVEGAVHNKKFALLALPLVEIAGADAEHRLDLGYGARKRLQGRG